MEFILNTVRRMENDQAKEYALGDKNSIIENLAIAFINPEDYNKVNPNKKPNIKISSKFGNTIVKLSVDEDVPERTILMPISIWSNQVTGIEKSELLYKNIKVNLEPTKELTVDFNAILQKIKEGQ